MITQSLQVISTILFIQHQIRSLDIFHIEQVYTELFIISFTETKQFMELSFGESHFYLCRSCQVQLLMSSCLAVRNQSSSQQTILANVTKTPVILRLNIFMSFLCLKSGQVFNSQVQVESTSLPKGTKESNNSDLINLKKSLHITHIIMLLAFTASVSTHVTLLLALLKNILTTHHSYLFGLRAKRSFLHD